VSHETHAIEALQETFKKSAALLKGAGIPFMLGGGLACWARGGPETYNDLDFFIKPEDAERALEALTSNGMRGERPPEDWLLKAWDGDVLVDLIFHPLGMEITDETIARAEEMNVAAIWTPVMPLDDVITTKLMALNEHFLNYEGLLGIARSLREQVDWEQVRSRTMQSSFARTFFVLLEELGIVSPHELSHRSGARIKVMPAPADQ
jgi:putative nucleotidyltransferase-like protein